MKKNLFRFLISFSLMALSFITQAATEFKIITLQHNFASDLLSIIEPMVGPDGTATGTNNQLILRATPARMREIESVVQTLDVAKENRKITVKSNRTRQQEQQRVEGSGKVKVGKVTVGNNRRAKPNSGHIDLENSTTRTQRNTNQFINVLDGERAFLRVGQIVPFTQEWINITNRYHQVQTTTEWREITTGFAVRPRTIGNLVELEITPRIAKLNSRGFIDFEELSTVVRVRLGEWVDIGSTMQNRDNVSRKILGFQQSSSSQQSGLVIKVD